MRKKVMVIATHPDDEILGCGGVIAKHVSNKDIVKTVVVCEGMTLRYNDSDIDLDKCRIKSAEVLGVHESCCLYKRDQRLDTIPMLELVQAIEKEVNEFEPNIIYCQNGKDINYDHKMVFEAAQVAVRPLNKNIEEVYTFYTPSSTEWGCPIDFVPDTWVDISDYLEVKIKAFSCYATEIKEFPHPRSIDNLKYMAYFFGAQANMNAAECLKTIKRYVRK